MHCIYTHTHTPTRTHINMSKHLILQKLIQDIAYRKRKNLCSLRVYIDSGVHITDTTKLDQ